MVSRRGLLGGAAALVGGGTVADAGAARADEALDTPFTPVGTPHLAQAEQLVGYQRLLAAGYLTDGLVGHWALDGSGADRSGHEHPVTLGSGASWTALRAGRELSLDGTSGAYAATDSVLDTTAPFKGVFSGTADFPGETQYAVEIVDCTSDPHGVYALTNYPAYPDTRMVGTVPGENLQGVGIGHMMFYASDATGEFSRYRWSVNSAKSTGTYDVTARPVAAARVS
ncbi:MULTISPECIES: hypothetical protein [unclassified Streptomyces]|uniref:hypothetical protein n=1 Tax=unclassified Streptomyces TaxID=2593676 RepID=UPI00403CA518